MPACLGPDKRATISKNLLFGALEEDELDVFLDLSIPQRYPRDRVIFSKGDPGDGLYVIADGRVGIKTISKHGKEIFLNSVNFRQGNFPQHHGAGRSVR